MMVKLKCGDEYILVDEEYDNDKVDVIDKADNLEDTLEFDFKLENDTDERREN